jgi:DeoR/GlpR family transcriptional regulator of sugar metabolism
MLGPKYYRNTNDLVSYTRQKDITPIRHGELIMQLVEKKGYVKRADAIDLLHVPDSQAYRALARLVKDGRLVLEGSGAGARYVKNNV